MLSERAHTAKSHHHTIQRTCLSSHLPVGLGVFPHSLLLVREIDGGISNDGVLKPYGTVSRINMAIHTVCALKQMHIHPQIHTQMHCNSKVPNPMSTTMRGYVHRACVTVLIIRLPYSSILSIKYHSEHDDYRQFKNRMSLFRNGTQSQSALQLWQRWVITPHIQRTKASHINRWESRKWKLWGTSVSANSLAIHSSLWMNVLYINPYCTLLPSKKQSPNS